MVNALLDHWLYYSSTTREGISMEGQHLSFTFFKEFLMKILWMDLCEQSRSPTSAPILFVKRRDGTFSFLGHGWMGVAQDNHLQHIAFPLISRLLGWSYSWGQMIRQNLIFGVHMIMFIFIYPREPYLAKLISRLVHLDKYKQSIVTCRGSPTNFLFANFFINDP